MSRTFRGHGYDAVFISDGYDQTIAEMSFKEKNTYSHPFIPLQRLIEACIKDRGQITTILA